MHVFRTHLFLLLALLPSLSMATEDFKIDQNVHLSDLKGKVVYIDFWASWCKPCRASFPWMNDMQTKYRNQGLEVISINLDETKSNALEFLERLPANFKIVYDPEGAIATQYELVGMPSSYIIDKKGELRISHTGFFEAKRKAYENEIQLLLAE